MRRTTRFRQLIDRPEILLLPGAHDALAARLIELAGFDALTAGGYAAHATLLGAPDIAQLGLAEMADHYGQEFRQSPVAYVDRFKDCPIRIPEPDRRHHCPDRDERRYQRNELKEARLRFGRLLYPGT